MNLLALLAAILLDPVLWAGAVLAGLLPRRYPQAAFLGFGWAITCEGFLSITQATYSPGPGSLIRIALAIGIASTIFLIRRRKRSA